MQSKLVSAFSWMQVLKLWPHKYESIIELNCSCTLEGTDHTQSGSMLGLQLYAEQCTLISLSLLSHTHLHGCHNYHTKEFHSDTMHRASRRCSFMNPSDSNWLSLLHNTCSCLSVYYDSVVSSFAERLLSLGLEDRRKDYRGNHVLLDKIPTWANHDSNTGKSRISDFFVFQP